MHPKLFIDSLRTSGVSFFTGVPDSLLKDLLAYIEETVPKKQHITAANEGGAIGIAAGYHLATSSVPAVYMQNSGLGNAVNPLTSLADKEVYAIPMLLIIGWRGEPGVKDEPQHIKQGRITPSLLEVLEIPHAIIEPGMDALTVEKEITRMVALAKEQGRPAALLVRSGVFEAYKTAARPARYPLGREESIEMIIDSLAPQTIVVSTTGKISRELYESRKKRGEGTEKDFLTVGSMGHASQIALGIAQQKPDRLVYCLDGDGATLMQLGGLATVGWVKPPNFRHIVLNNLAHESVGGQPSAAATADLAAAARACGYASVLAVETKADLEEALRTLPTVPAPAFLEVKVNLESRTDLGRPKETPQENKKGFMDYLHGSN
ncbi:phosphonopyruvate decarboxylase [Candidatus Kaiserbacteria bacterium]|nr:phosphonopyruvate decarboxylase [Candidatus Kaiserbacteria bacterium]